MRILVPEQSQFRKGGKWQPIVLTDQDEIDLQALLREGCDREPVSSGSTFGPWTYLRGREYEIDAVTEREMANGLTGLIMERPDKVVRRERVQSLVPSLNDALRSADENAEELVALKQRVAELEAERQSRRSTTT
jgi:hypothetical protein